jgi:hypothetical protein
MIFSFLCVAIFWFHFMKSTILAWKYYSKYPTSPPPTHTHTHTRAHTHMHKCRTCIATCYKLTTWSELISKTKYCHVCINLELHCVKNRCICSRTIVSKLANAEFKSSRNLRVVFSTIDKGAHSIIVGWGTMLHPGRLWVWVPMMSLNFFSSPNLSSCTMALGLTQPLTEMSTRKCFCGECGWRVRLTYSVPSVSWLSRQCGILNISQPYRLPWPVMGIAYFPKKLEYV